MNKPELIKRVAINFCFHTMLAEKYNVLSVTRGQEERTMEEAKRPDNYELYITEAEMFVEELLYDGVINE